MAVDILREFAQSARDNTPVDLSALQPQLEEPEQPPAIDIDEEIDDVVVNDDEDEETNAFPTLEEGEYAEYIEANHAFWAGALVFHCDVPHIAKWDLISDAFITMCNLPHDIDKLIERLSTIRSYIKEGEHLSAVPKVTPTSPFYNIVYPS